MKSKKVDKVFINRLHVQASIGILPHELECPQPVYLDLELAVDAHLASSRDDIGDAVDYAAVRRGVIALLEQQHFNLVETLAERLAQYLMDAFQLPACRVSVTKPQAFDDAEGVGVVICRGSWS